MKPLAAAALVLGLALATGSGIRAEVLEGTVASLVFEREPLRRLDPAGAVLHYRFEIEGRDIPAPHHDKAVMEVSAADAEGAREVRFELFSGEARRAFGPLAARAQNPLVLVFLQLDVNEMGNLTGGAPGYFQQQIRKAFNRPAEVEETRVSVDGGEVPAVRVRIRPFLEDPNIARFPAFREKSYEFVMSDSVPGGVYRLAATTPAPEGEVILLEKSMTFERIGR